MKQEIFNKLQKKVTINFPAILKNPETLFEEEINWENLKVNENVADALKELFLAGCRVEIKTDLDKQNLINFLEEVDLIDFVKH